ncbi:MAG: hypothetical protein WB816_01660 [Methylocystis sp.]
MSACDFDRDYVVLPGSRPLHARPAGNIAAAMIGVVAFLVLGVAMIFFKPQPTTEARREAAPVPGDFTPSPAGNAPVKQYNAFDLNAPEFAKEKKALSSRRIEDSGGREDSLTLGDFALGGPYLRLDIRQTSADKRGNPDFFLEMTRHAAQAGLAVGKIGQRSPLASRFGSFEAADIRLSQQAAGDGAPTERACLALRLISGKQPVEIAGVACGDAAKPLDRRALGCILDRLDYLPNGENAAFDKFFLSAEQDRGRECGGGALSPSAEKSNWLDAHSTPPALKTEPTSSKRPKKAR